MYHKVSIKNLRVSAKKMRMLIKSIGHKKPYQLLDTLPYMSVKSAGVLYKVIKSAVENGSRALSADYKSLIFKELMVDEGPSLKRFRAGSRGMAKPFKRPSSHITIVLESEK